MNLDPTVLGQIYPLSVNLLGWLILLQNRVLIRILKLRGCVWEKIAMLLTQGFSCHVILP